MRAQTWSVRIDIAEDDSSTHAHAVLFSRDGITMSATGDVRRRPNDVLVPEIGEELAVARALHALADELMEVAAADVSALAHPAAG